MNTENQKIIGGVIVLIIIVAALGYWFMGSDKLVAPPAPQATTTGSGATTTNSTASSTGLGSSGAGSFTTPAKFNPKDPWSVLAQYLIYAKAHDIAGVKSLSHQQSPTCADAKKQKECFALMDSVYAIGKDLKADNYSIKKEDAKQLVLLGSIARDSDGKDSYGYRQGVIIFTKSSNGDLKLLTFNPNRGWYVAKDEGETDASAEVRVRLMMEDNDEDIQDDRAEACVGQPANCVETNPNKRDTDGDGWWDGVEAFFR